MQSARGEGELPSWCGSREQAPTKCGKNIVVRVAAGSLAIFAAIRRVSISYR